MMVQPDRVTPGTKRAADHDAPCGRAEKRIMIAREPGDLPATARAGAVSPANTRGRCVTMTDGAAPPRKLWLPSWIFLFVCLGLAAVGGVMVSIDEERRFKAERALPVEERQRRDAEREAKAVEERQKQEASWKEFIAQEARKTARAENLCRLRSSCAQYPAARQDCAVAARFADCIEIKIGVGLGACTAQGQVSNPPPDMPGWFDCLVRDYVP
jgi:hypothetical protein